MIYLAGNKFGLIASVIFKGLQMGKDVYGNFLSCTGW